jgi:hypothetical protein
MKMQRARQYTSSGHMLHSSSPPPTKPCSCFLPPRTKEKKERKTPQKNKAENPQSMKPTTPAAAATATSIDPSPSASTSVTFTVERRGDASASASCLWTLPDFPRTRARTFYTRYFEVGGFDCRLLLYPRGDSQALPGYLSLYLQVLDPKTPVSSSSSTTTSSSKWDCFLSYRLSVVHATDPAKSVGRDSWHRFSSKKRSHGWCDFAPSASAAFSSSPTTPSSLPLTYQCSLIPPPLPIRTAVSPGRCLILVYSGR